MGTAIKIDGRSIAPVRRKIHAMRDRVDNLTAAWEVLLDWFADQERRQFGSRGARWRSIWPELARSTLTDKRGEGYTTDILVRTGELGRSLSDRPMSVERILPHEVVAGTRVRYAKYHQYGTKYMPRRLLISAEQVARENAATSAVISWIITGRAEVRAEGG
jgi:hypothetical protein